MCLDPVRQRLKPGLARRKGRINKTQIWQNIKIAVVINDHQTNRRRRYIEQSEI